MIPRIDRCDLPSYATSHVERGVAQGASNRGIAEVCSESRIYGVPIQLENVTLITPQGKGGEWAEVTDMETHYAMDSTVYGCNQTLRIYSTSHHRIEGNRLGYANEYEDPIQLRRGCWRHSLVVKDELALRV